MNNRKSTTLAGIGVVLTMTVIHPVHAASSFERGEHRLSASDRKFVQETAEDQKGDIAMGRLAEARGVTASVRAFGRRQVVDHTRTYADLQRTAERFGYRPVDHPGPKQWRMIHALEARHGVAFDRLYRRDMIKDHVDDVETFRRQIAAAHSAAIRRYAARTLPVLRQHLRLAMAMSPTPRAYAHRR